MIVNGGKQHSDPELKAQLGCQHKEWIGRPVGCVPTYWQCCDCMAEMTAGEMIIYSKLCQQSGAELTGERTEEK